eukprot:536723_1
MNDITHSIYVNKVPKYFINKKKNISDIDEDHKDEQKHYNNDRNNSIKSEETKEDSIENELNMKIIDKKLIDEICDEYKELKEDEQFILNWNHIVNALKYQWNPKASKLLKNIVDDNEFVLRSNDFSDETIKYVLDKMQEDELVDKQHLLLMKLIIQKAQDFDPITQGCIDDITNDDDIWSGILYWLGTDKNRREWRDPVIHGDVRVFSNAKLGSRSESIKSILGLNCFRFCTENKQNSWIIIDFYNISIYPTHYLLQHYKINNKFCLRNWYLEGYYNGEWIKLSVHINDTHLNKPGDMYKWEIPRHTNRDKKLFSRFRIFQFGVNSSDTYCLALSRFEIYGIAKFKNKKRTNIKRSFTYAPDDETKGLIHYLATTGTKIFKNPADTKILLTSTPLQTKSCSLSILCDKVNGSCYTQSCRGSFIALNLKLIQIKLKKYTLRNNENNRNILRNWNLEGSHDGVEWCLIRKHENDASLTKPSEKKSWDVQSGEYLSQFRIITTGQNNESNYCLSCSGIELYGEAIICDLKMNNSNDIFIYASDGDTNGLLYHLGLSSNAKQSYTNPTVTGKVLLSSSSLDRKSSLLSCFVGRDAATCITNPNKASFIAIHLKDITLMVTKYTLRNTFNSRNSLRNWNFEGSHDGMNWNILKQHQNDESLNSKSGIHSWDVDCNKFFSHFRIIITGKNADNKWRLGCGGIELYGVVGRDNDKCLDIYCSLLTDVYSIHKHYFYYNEFKDYSTHEYIDSMRYIGYFDSSVYTTRTDVFPYFLIDEDPGQVMKYLLSASQYICKNMKWMKWMKNDLDDFTLTIFVYP